MFTAQPEAAWVLGSDLLPRHRGRKERSDWLHYALAWPRGLPRSRPKQTLEWNEAERNYASGPLQKAWNITEAAVRRALRRRVVCGEPFPSPKSVGESYCTTWGPTLVTHLFNLVLEQSCIVWGEACWQIPSSDHDRWVFTLRLHEDCLFAVIIDCTTNLHT